MSPRAPVESLKERLCGLLHGGYGMIAKDDVQKILAELIRGEHNEELELIALAVTGDVRGAYTFKEILELITKIETQQ